jgi:DNA-binding winged helix-turn-helix (wHTH) protein/tetratricopeptide (TPR) repeat protein
MSQKVKSTYRFGEFDLEVDSRLLVRQGERVPLGSKAFEVLVQLVMRAGEVVPKDELLQAVWPASFVEERNLTQQVSSLRKAFGNKADYIRTVPGRGYQFTERVIEVPKDTLLQTLDNSILAQADASILPASSHAELLHTVHERTEVTFEESSYLTFPAHRKAISWGFWQYALAAAALLALGVWVGWRLSKHSAPLDHRQVVLADFINTTSDASFGQTLKRALAIDLDQSPYIEVLSDRDVIATLQLMERKSDTPLTPDVAREVCERANRQVLLTGNVTAVGSQYLLTLEATDCATGKRLASAKADARTREDVLGALDSVAQRVRRELGESEKSVASYQVPIAQATTSSLEALKMYSIGSYLASQGKDENETMPFYQKAIELDPQFAMAYSSLAGLYYNQEQFALASQNDAKAFALSDHVSAKEQLVIQAHYYGEGQNDILNGIKTYKVWADTYPHDFLPFANLCNQYSALGLYEPAIEAGKRALELQKERGQIYSMLALALMRANRFSEAKAVGTLAQEHHQETGRLHATLFAIAVIQKDQTAVAHEREWAERNNTGWYAWFFPAVDATVSASAGRYGEARALFRKSVEVAKNEQNLSVMNDVLAEEAKTELAFGLQAAAHATLSQLSYEPIMPTDYLLTSIQLGNTKPAERYLDEYKKPVPDTQITYLNLPRVRAALLMHRNEPQQAVDALELTRPYELFSFDAPTERAVAYLKLGQPAKAVQEYQKILANPGVDPTEFEYPFAHLGLARAYAQTGDVADSRAEYRTFLQLWKDADSDLPVLKTARAELEKLPK